MHFPIADVTINPFFLMILGLVVGILGGFFGIGGGFLTAPALYLFGLPMHFVPGTDLAHMVGKSIVAARRHRALGNVDLRLGLIMAIPTMLGVEVGAQLVALLERVGRTEPVIAPIYIFVLLCISAVVGWESYLTLRKAKWRRLRSKRVHLPLPRVARFFHGIAIPPRIGLPISGIESISIWAIASVGFFTGIVAGLLGVGGGFIRMPAMIYLLGIPTHIAVGTDLFEIVISASYGTITHGLKGNVDILIALVMHTGAAIGAQIGALSTSYVSGPQLRLAFSFLPLLGAALVAWQLFSGGVFGH